MKFSSYMQEWLYGEDGYYSGFKQIGKGGDFYTSVSASRFFGGSIAKKIIKTIDEGYLSKDCTILEVGAHQGYLLADIIQFIYTLRADLIDSLSFGIVEPKDKIMDAQKKYMESSFGNAVSIGYFSSFDEIKLNSAFIVCNEIFDAFACEVIKDEKMLYIKDGEFYFDNMPENIKKIAESYNIKKGEITIGYNEFIKKVTKSIKRFEFVTFDYGEMQPKNEYTLRVYHKHKVYPFFSLTKFAKDFKLDEKEIKVDLLYKNSDITYDVVFAQLIDEFRQNSVELVSFSTQLKALVEFGIVELLEILRNNVDKDIYQRELNRAKTLIDPAFLGERFKCAIFRNQ